MIKTYLFTPSFKKSLKKCLEKGCDRELIKDAISLLIENEQLPEEYNTHRLTAGRTGQWEAHLDDDLLLIWKQTNDKITFIDIGTHEELFHYKKH